MGAKKRSVLNKLLWSSIVLKATLNVLTIYSVCGFSQLRALIRKYLFDEIQLDVF